MDNELFKLYVLAELSYKKHFSNLNDDELFPSMEIRIIKRK